MEYFIICGDLVYCWCGEEVNKENLPLPKTIQHDEKGIHLVVCAHGKLIIDNIRRYDESPYLLQKILLII